MLSNFDLQGLGYDPEAKAREIESYGIIAQNFIRAGQGLSPLPLPSQDPLYDIKRNWQKYTAYGLVGYFVYKIAMEYAKRR